MMQRFLRDERGSTAIEHSLIAALISIAIIGGLSLTADEVTALFDNIEAGVTEATN